MNIEKVHNKIRYTLSNENLNLDDEVYPIARGRRLDNDGWILHELDFSELTSGFPDEPHIIKELKYVQGSQDKVYEVITDKGYSHIECYFKIIKIEKNVKVKDYIFGDIYKWIEM